MRRPKKLPRKPRELIPFKAKCEHCHTAFDAFYRTARFCSPPCRFAAWAKKHPRT